MRRTFIRPQTHAIPSQHGVRRLQDKYNELKADRERAAFKAPENGILLYGGYVADKWVDVYKRQVQATVTQVTENGVTKVLINYETVPEPATATLSLLGLGLSLIHISFPEREIP